MSTPDTTEPMSSSFQAEVFDKTPEEWVTIRGQIIPMSQEAFNWGEGQPIEGQTNNIIAYSNIEDAFKASDTTAILLRDKSQQVVGFSLAFPFEKMDPKTAKKYPNAAYIYFTALNVLHRGQGLVGRLTEPMFEELHKRGFSYAVRDSVKKNGYAGKVEKHYAGSIIERIDHRYWSEIGPETRFVIDIAAHLAQHSQLSTESSE